VKTDTKYFGEIEYSEDEIIRFPKGLYGFEDEHEFLLLPFSGKNTLYSLQSLKTPQLAFVMVDPFTLDTGYAPVLQKEELQAMGVEKSEELYFYTMCVVKDPVGESTVNLKCPVAIHADELVAEQFILEGEQYHMRHKLSEFNAQEGEQTC
jgi:flagellar assembly factor FliW